MKDSPYWDCLLLCCWGQFIIWSIVLFSRFLLKMRQFPLPMLEILLMDMDLYPTQVEKEWRVFPMPFGHF